MKPRPTLWLAVPSRFAGLSRRRARIAMVLLALVLLASLTALVAVVQPPASGDPARHGGEQSDLILYETIVSGVQHGGDYYTVASQALRAGDYPLRPFFTMRMPALAMVQARLPHAVVLLTLYLLAFCVMAAWSIRLREALRRWQPVAIGLVLLAGGMLAFIQADLWAFHEIWAGLLIALSLAVRRPGRWLEAVALGLAATLIRETAALYVVLMGVMAWREGERREARGWAAALLLFALAVGAHAYAVSAVTTVTDPASPGWAGLHGAGFFVKAVVLSTALQLFPLWIAAPLFGLSLFGWASWRDPLAARLVAMLLGYGVLMAVFARADTFYWALLVAPLSLVGLVFAPDGLHDLARQALDKRRITVTRVSR
ncbi:hypothetical protein ACG3SL_03390 [Sphingomonas sp. CJ20]